MRLCSVVVLGLCKATWGKDVPQHEGQRGYFAEQGGAQIPQQPLRILCCTRSELEGSCALSQEFSWKLFTQSPICFTLCWMLWEMPKIKTPIQVLERKFLRGGTNQWTPVPVGSSWKFTISHYFYSETIQRNKANG